jgi:hypothetical protein
MQVNKLNLTFNAVYGTKKNPRKFRKSRGLKDDEKFLSE